MPLSGKFRAVAKVCRSNFAFVVDSSLVDDVLLVIYGTG